MDVHSSSHVCVMVRGIRAECNGQGIRLCVDRLGKDGALALADPH
jgi:hypothetical protein